jgi:plasmid stabilization system protein ParE
MRVVLSEKADFDLVNIYRYLYEHNPSAADNFIQRVQANFENLASFPFIGRERSSLARLTLPYCRTSSGFLSRRVRYNYDYSLD